ncbi:MAG: ABC transporter substrate-binding protein [Thaumarchaeota archaeon]|nr:ABC transporter substrate-binding protein [Nitrososphaerota archaeon]
MRLPIPHARRKAIGRSTVAIVIIIVIVLAGGAYFYSTSTGGNKSTTSSATTGVAAPLSLTFANVPNADPAKGSDEASSAAAVNLYDSLVFPTASGALVPDLATSQSVSSDGLTYTFNLRTTATFHNGDPVTADDVVFSMNRLLSIGQGYAYLFTPYVKSTTATDTHTVVISLKKTFGPFLSAIVRLYVLDKSLVNQHIANQTAGPNGDYGSTWLLTHDAGSGPYQMVSANLLSDMTFSAYANYWNGTNANQPQTVKFIGTSDPATVNALFSKGQIQITDQWQPYSNVQSLAALKGAKIVHIPTVNEFYLMVNTQAAPTDDILVREAMSYAFNYTAITANVFPGSQASAGPVPSALPGHNPNIPTSHQDVAKAQSLIQQSKYAGSLSSYPIKYYWVAEVPAEEQMAVQFASDMQKIGLTVNVVKQPWLSVVASLASQTSSPNVVSITDGASYFEAGSVLQSRYTTPSEGTWEQNEWLHNATLDNLIFSALSTQDQTQRFQQYYAIQAQIYNQYPTVYAFDVTENRAYYPTVVNWYAANGQPDSLLGYDFVFRNFQFFPAQMTALFG